MKALKIADLLRRTSRKEDTKSLCTELEDYLSGVFQGVKTGFIEERGVCDRVMRACNEQLVEKKQCPAHLQNLVNFADLACRGYMACGPQQNPLYIEKILYHLLKNIISQGASNDCLIFSQHLYNCLLTYSCIESQSELLKDFEALTKSCFSALWKGAENVSKVLGYQAAFSHKLHAIRFLIFLEGVVPLTESDEPANFLSVVARHTASASGLWGNHNCLKQNNAILMSEDIFKLLIEPLMQEIPWSETLQLQKLFCLFELTLLNCKLLCKVKCYKEGQETVIKALNILLCANKSSSVFISAFRLCVFATGLQQASERGSLESATFLADAAATLCSLSTKDCSLLEQKVLLDCCNFFVSTVEKCFKSENGKKEYSTQSVLNLFCFLEKYCPLLQKLMDKAIRCRPKTHKLLKQFYYHCLQLFCTVMSYILQVPKERGSDHQQLISKCCSVAEWMVDGLQDMSEEDQMEYINLTASCIYSLAYSLYNQRLYSEASSVMGSFCKRLSIAVKVQLSAFEKLQKCFKLLVESCKKAGEYNLGLNYIGTWLTTLHENIGLFTPPVSHWVRLKADAAKNGQEELRLVTLRDALESGDVQPTVMVAILDEELKAYKSLHANTRQERFNVICDLLDICSEESGLLHERAFYLIELAQVLCYGDFSEHTDCSALDSVSEALRLLNLLPETPDNQSRLLDDKAHGSLWLYICTLESKMRESIERDQRILRLGSRGRGTFEEFKSNDLNYEDKLQDEQFVQDGIAFNLEGESGHSKYLDDALADWKKLINSVYCVPAVRNTEQTIASIHILAALYRLIGRPLQAVESCLLVLRLAEALSDSFAVVKALCQLSKLLFMLECPSYAEIYLDKAEDGLQLADLDNDGYMLMKLTCALLRSQLYCVTNKAEEGLNLLLEILTAPSLQKSSKVWYLLKADALQLVGTYLSLPVTILPLHLRHRLQSQGWKTPETAFTDAHRLLCSIIILLIGNGVLSSQKSSIEVTFSDHGSNLLQKWQVFSDLLTCSQRLVSLLGRVGCVCEAKAFCLEALNISTKLHLVRGSGEFLIAKATLELQRNEPELSYSDLQQVLFLVESCTDYGTKEIPKEVKIKLKKGQTSGKTANSAAAEKSKDEETSPDFLKCPSLEFIATVNGDKEGALTASPILKSKTKKRLAILSHATNCSCESCSDIGLSLISTKWAVVFSDAEAASGNKVESQRLLEMSLKRCQILTSRFSSVLCNILSDEHAGNLPKKGKLGSLYPMGLLCDLASGIYSRLARLFLNNEVEKRAWDALSAGFEFLTSKMVLLGDLEHSKACMLLIKAITSICTMATHRHCGWADIFPVWTWKSSCLSVPEKKSRCSKLSDSGSRTETEKKPVKEKTKTSVITKKQGTAKTQISKLPPLCSRDPFLMEDSDSDIPKINIKTSVIPAFKTPTHKDPQVSKSCGNLKPAVNAKLCFQVFEENSPNLKHTAPKAPRVSKKVRSRFQVQFSDDSDNEDIIQGSQKDSDDVASSGQTCTVSKDSVACNKKGQRCGKISGHQWTGVLKTQKRGRLVSASVDSIAEDREQKRIPASRKITQRAKSSSDENLVGKQESDVMRESAAHRSCAFKSAESPKCKEEKYSRTTRTAAKLANEVELMRTIREEETENLEHSLEILRGSDGEDSADQLSSDQRKGCTEKDALEMECEILRRDIGREQGESILIGRKVSSLTPLTSHPASATVFPANGASLEDIFSILQEAYHSVSHCPPSAFYSQLCCLMAMCTGEKDPYLTAYLVSESISTTIRHQMITNIHRKLCKTKKDLVSEVADKMQELNINEGEEDRVQRFSEVEQLFEFHCSGPSNFPQQEKEAFRGMVEQIPNGVVVCVLSLASLQPGTIGDSLLLSRLEKGCLPVTVHISTSKAQMSLSSAVCEFDAIMKEQKAVCNLTDKREWWEGRIELDRRMKHLIESMEDGLSCWKGMLLPAVKDLRANEEAVNLQKRLVQLGWKDADAEMLKVVLSGAHLLSPQCVKAFVNGLSQHFTDDATKILQTAVDKVKHWTRSTKGHLVLVLDKHLQKLPWEAVPALQSSVVTRLPSLRFLLSYSVMKKFQSRSVLTNGVDPSRTFYVLNPQANLPWTEEHFRDWFKSETGWQGVCGEAPTSQQLQSALSTKDMYIYAGHGAGAHFLDGQSLLKLECHAVALLFGCSSAALAVRGQLDGSGIVLKYIMAGCPLVLGNLWDVTDRDIDRYMEALLQSWLKAGSKAPLLDYVVQSRQAPKLKHLIGAAPVVYGLPVSLQ
ncbi:separin [Protopterus annectens]|uniref:separin n=1 Tax=Protopterus annectens TaxID=7888 RepID=UPI001CFB763E|nr:separin [Protopterus annectens]